MSPICPCKAVGIAPVPFSEGSPPLLTFTAMFPSVSPVLVVAVIVLALGPGFGIEQPVLDGHAEEIDPDAQKDGVFNLECLDEHTDCSCESFVSTDVRVAICRMFAHSCSYTCNFLLFLTTCFFLP